MPRASKPERDSRVLLILIKKWGTLKGEAFWGCCCWGVSVEEIDLVVGSAGVVAVVAAACCFSRSGVVILAWMSSKLDDVKKMLAPRAGLMRLGRRDLITPYPSLIPAVRYATSKVGDTNQPLQPQHPKIASHRHHPPSGVSSLHLGSMSLVLLPPCD